MIRVHATCIAFDGKGILLRGPSGSGKSDLALRAIAAGARLVADDQVLLNKENGRLFASAPQMLYGKIEIRGLGIFKLEADLKAEIAMIVDLVDSAVIERLPEPERCSVDDVDVPRVALAPFESAAAVKLRFALAAALDPGVLETDGGAP